MEDTSERNIPHSIVFHSIFTDSEKKRYKIYTGYDKTGLIAFTEPYMSTANLSIDKLKEEMLKAFRERK